LQKEVRVATMAYSSESSDQLGLARCELNLAEAAAIWTASRACWHWWYRVS